MKLTPELRLHILETAGVYAARFGIPEPRILMSTREVLELPRHITTGRRTTTYKYYGVAYIQYNTIFLNVRKMPDAGGPGGDHSARTGAHEVPVSIPREALQGRDTAGPGGAPGSSRTGSGRPGPRRR